MPGLPHPHALRLREPQPETVRQYVATIFVDGLRIFDEWIRQPDHLQLRMANVEIADLGRRPAVVPLPE